MSFLHFLARRTTRMSLLSKSSRFAGLLRSGAAKHMKTLTALPGAGANRPAGRGFGSQSQQLRSLQTWTLCRFTPGHASSTPLKSSFSTQSISE